MKLTSQQEFGLRCLLRLAREDTTSGARDESGNTLPVNKISEDEGLSNEYAGKLMLVLSRAGLVDSVRGRNGGYRLARPAAEISVAEVLDALGGKLYDHETCDRFSGDRNLCIHTDACNIRSVWTGLQYLIDQVLTRTSLQDLVDHSEEGMAEWVQRHIQALVESESPASGRGEGPPSRDRRSYPILEVSPARGYRGRPVPPRPEDAGPLAGETRPREGSDSTYEEPGRTPSREGAPGDRDPGGVRVGPESELTSKK